MASVIASVGRRGVAGVTGAVFSALAQFALVVVVTRAFTAAEAGAFFTVTALVLMAAGIAKLDAGNGLIYFIARAKIYDYHGISGYIRAAFWPGVVAACAAAALLHPHLGLTAVAIPLMVAGDVLLCATRGFGAMRPTVLLDGVFVPGCQLVLVTAVALAGAVWWLPVAWAAPYALLPVLAAAGLRGRAPRTPYLQGTGRDLWRHTAPRSVAGAIQAVFQRVDIVIVAALAGPAQAAVYTAATRFKVVGQLANQGLAQAVQDRLVRALAEGEWARAGELYQAATIWLVVMTWPVWLGYAALAPWLLHLFGPSYAQAGPVALVLAGTMMVATACGMVDVVLTAAGHTGASLRNLLAAIACTVALDLALIPAHGALGAVIGWSGGVLVKNLLPLWQLHRRYGLHPFGRHTLAALRPRSWAAA
ncbi:polysaccharide biosynthesis protein [Nonomuraea sp. KC401]|uniref:lipopolysaccharide biosynthesis protein n=1 Tax=unclassified Nonomuraea TaxID=2593643 RepID=UPI0010FDB969|nr:polysaccharide biosynthesis C-terminal domain-containing protein [Nonomuraea sp. KC401]NBE93658.1 polysaccharide biosynthesis protein [Nonomuraea sp. K271]TLF85279.1 polysaccharide biosynthesis protein [Nonomuraea sp. KC401]